MNKGLEVYPGKVKRSRVVRFETSNDEITRPIEQIHAREIRSSVHTDSEVKKDAVTDSRDDNACNWDGTLTT
ncbi:hypothetical protein HNY73_007462 [Argiope bruennichi]|uniref:Uncharacterized protein n=1 Tax=Argiope bruennichi TaxID=94029 RepID=A0A8T0FJI1_ARGBR|nr:hypothetical protein HNY73_007462 [Argiope bruennichi]